ncbi:MAG TPA: glycosyltransferase, partial [Solirubrobacteraceae bacterium]|nr:glycosyltransferase [Solirubrobacteraceae bacterium]
IGPALAGLGADPDVTEVVVVDDESTDATAQVARAAGARVVTGAPLPEGWRGKAWALQQGLEAARGDWVLSVDADTRPRPGLARALAAALGDDDLLSAGPRFVCEGAGERMVHPAQLATMIYRFGPTDVEGWQPPPGRAMANGQCVIARRERLLALGGWELVRGNMTEDAAMARAVRRAGGRVAFIDGAALLDVRMYESARETLREWSRSLLAPDVTSSPWLAADLAVLWLCQALPLAQVLSRRGGRLLPPALLALRLVLHAALRRSYARPRLAFWLAPLADVLVVARLTWSALRPTRSWRGRSYG